MTVHQLRKVGCKVTVHHNRYWKNSTVSRPMGPVPSHTIAPSEFYARGGRTFVQIVFPADSVRKEKVVTCEAVCSLADNYNRKIGVAIAVGRALKLPKVTNC